jgi:hypothetical protein
LATACKTLNIAKGGLALCKEIEMTRSNRFPQYPQLQRIAYSDQYGRMELLELSRTSDGFLIGMALIGEGDEQYMHSVFLGFAPERS